jgi:hypothetical protein
MSINPIFCLHAFSFYSSSFVGLRVLMTSVYFSTDVFQLSFWNHMPGPKSAGLHFQLYHMVALKERETFIYQAIPAHLCVLQHYSQELSYGISLSAQ